MTVMWYLTLPVFVLRTTPRVMSSCRLLVRAWSTLSPYQQCLFVPTYVVLTESGNLWHRHLGHCGASVSDVLWKNSLLQFKTVFSNKCVSCCSAKSHRLPFQHRTSSPLQLIHSDGWQSPVLSHQGYKYYVSFIDDYSRFT